MLSFKAPAMEDQQWVSDILRHAGVRSCELCFGNLYIWSVVYDNSITKFKEFFIGKNNYTDFNSYTVPIGSGNFEEALCELIEDAQGAQKACRLHGVTDSDIERIEKMMPGKFEFRLDRNNCDYIYSAEKMITLSGKKYHSKRNHITNFKKQNPDWCFEKIDADNILECVAMHEKWIAENGESDDYLSELKVVKRAFDNYQALGFIGGLIRTQGQVIAYTFGETLGNGIFCTHIEKAFSSIRGAYPIMNQEFSANCLKEYTLINREEDLGIEGLRRAKLSYNPVELLNKSVAIYRG